MANIVARILEEEYPEKLSELELCCFDKASSNNFNYIKQNIPEIARNCVDILIEAIVGNTECRHIVVNADLVSRTKASAPVNI